MITHFVGIDVQSARGCACAILRRDSFTSAAIWEPNASMLVDRVRAHVRRDGAEIGSCVVTIDSPRRPLVNKRAHYWDSSRLRWRRRRLSELGYGRHCEVVISAHGLANPQWTPLASAAPAWMTLGFELFARFSSALRVHEAFPNASYGLLRGQRVSAQIDLGAFFGGPKDMLDAYVCAITAQEFEGGRGCEVGNGDGLGAIILPRPPLERIEAAMCWPQLSLESAQFGH